MALGARNFTLIIVLNSPSKTTPINQLPIPLVPEDTTQPQCRNPFLVTPFLD